MPKKQFKFDTDRIAIMFLTIVFAIVFRLLTHTWLKLDDFSVSAVVSPILGLLLAQYVIERQTDAREVGIFFLSYIIFVNLLNLMPVINNFELFTIQLNTKLGVIFSAGIYLITIPLSVIMSDIITDRMKKRK